VESVKAASDVYAPVSGTVTEVNKALSTDSGAVNKSAESSAWFVKLKLKDPKELDTLLDAAAYKAACDAEKH
jgi:glycine cleavage system H protein